MPTLPPLDRIAMPGRIADALGLALRVEFVQHAESA